MLLILCYEAILKSIANFFYPYITAQIDQEYYSEQVVILRYKCQGDDI
jgi:hypothetical protein